MSLTQPIYTIEVLTARHDRKSFSCGNEALDKYLYYQANQDIKKHIAAVFVLVEKGKQKILGYYTLSAIAIDAGELPQQIIKKLPKYKLLPATLLGRLAIDQQCQRKGLGGLLIIDALHRGINSSREIASMAMIVDAKDELAVTFYERYSFIRFFHQEKKLYLPMDTAVKVFQACNPINCSR